MSRPWSTAPRPRRDDLLLAVIVYLADIAMFSQVGTADSPATAAGVVALSFLPLPWRRQHATTVFGLVWIGAAVSVVLFPQNPPLLSMLVAVYTMAAYRPAREALVATVAGYALLAPAATRAEEAAVDHPLETSTVIALFVLWGLLIGGAAIIGGWVRRSRREIDTLEQRRRLAAAEAVAAERSRIARELHDIVSHSVSVMVLQAAGARRVMGRDPDRAEQALAQIEGVGKQAMSELRRLLGLLLDGDFVDERDRPQGLGPQPGLSNLPALLDTFRATGLVIDLTTTGRPLPLDDSIDLSAYRIAQEALTNASKHAGAGAHVVVSQTWHDKELVLTVADDGDAAASDPALSTGHGLVGLRERARAVGGRLDAGPLPAGGFEVTTTLPVAHVSAPGPELARGFG